MNYHMTVKSRNSKVGPIPVSTSTNETCPTCPFKGNGCYAESGPLALFWRKVSTGIAGNSFEAFCDIVKSLPEGQLWRHNQAGDLPGQDDKLDRAKCEALASANIGKKGFTYTHYDIVDDSENLAIVIDMNRNGFTVNASGNNLEHADRVAETGLPTVCVLPIEYETERFATTPNGRKVVVCPVVTGASANCMDCGLCAKQNRKVIVGFPAHGTSKKRANAIALA